jgi:hypothetical protein
MKNIILRLFISTFLLTFLTFNLPAQCTFTQIGNSCGCLTFQISTYSGSGTVATDVMTYSDGFQESIRFRPVVTHCFTQTGNVSATRTVTLTNGSSCSSPRTFTIGQCCPQIQNITGQNSNISYPRGCTSALTSVPECSHIFTPQLNVPLNSINATAFTWTVEEFNDNAWSLVCQQTGIRTLALGISPFRLNWRVTLSINVSNCPVQTFTKPFQISTTCNVSLKSNTDNTSDYYFSKQLTTYFYPNPVNNTLRISKMPEIENAQLEIQNIMGQTILNEKLTSSNTEINVSNFAKGMYLGVVKSNGKILYSEKIIKN